MKTVPKDEPVRFGLIGCGRIAQSHLAALATRPEARLTVAVESRKAAGEAVAEEHKATLYADYRDRGGKRGPGAMPGYCDRRSTPSRGVESTTGRGELRSEHGGPPGVGEPGAACSLEIGIRPGHQ